MQRPAPSGKRRTSIDTRPAGEVAFTMALYRYRRWVASFLSALWLVATAARPTAVGCPMGGHASAHGAGHTAAYAHSGAQESTAASGHDSHQLGAHDSHSTETPAPEAPSAPCDCLEHCCASVANVAPAVQVLASAPMRVRTSRAPSVRETAAEPRHDVVLPFATAPPTVFVG